MNGPRSRFVRTPTRVVGCVLLAAVLAAALFGPLFAPYAPDEPVGVPFSGPAEGTRSAPTSWVATSSHVFSGGAQRPRLGGACDRARVRRRHHDRPRGRLQPSLIDPVLDADGRRHALVPGVALPARPRHGAGTSKAVLVLGVALVQMPLIARIVRAATLEQSVRGFVEAAVARVSERARSSGARSSRTSRARRSGRRPALHLRDHPRRLRELPRARAPAPAADWALIISENRGGLTLNPYVILVPAALISLLTISVNLVGDAIARSLGISTARGGWSDDEPLLRVDGLRVVLDSGAPIVEDVSLELHAGEVLGSSASRAAARRRRRSPCSASPGPGR